jgi:fluoroquinolone resistance protein
MTKIQSQSEYEDREFDKLDFKAGQIYNTDFQNCIFTRCDFQRSIFSECRFDDCTFQACDFSLAKFKDSHFRDSIFISSKLIGIDWAEISRTFSIDFRDCVINLSNFSAMNLKKRKILNCIAHEVSFAETNMTECDCTMTDFAGSIFSKTNLTKANFSNARNYAIDVRNNTVTKLKLSLPEALTLFETLGIIITDR